MSFLYNTSIYILSKKKKKERNDTQLPLVISHGKGTLVKRMRYRCEALGQWDQVHQLQLLQKITLMKIREFFDDMSNQKMKIVYHLSYTCTSTKMPYFFMFLSRIMQNS